MSDIAAIGARHLADALAGRMSSVEVTEWHGEGGKPVVIYWKALTGAEQQKIDEFKTEVEKTCATVKYRARDETGKLIFSALPIESLVNDFDYNVIRAIAFNMVIDIPESADDRIDDHAKE